MNVIFVGFVMIYITVALNVIGNSHTGNNSVKSDSVADLMISKLVSDYLNNRMSFLEKFSTLVFV